MLVETEWHFEGLSTYPKLAPIRRSATAELSQRSKDFIRKHIQSVWQLELLLLYKNTSGSMTTEEAGRMLYLDPRAIESCIQMFVDTGILKAQFNQRYEYSPSSALASSIDETARMYQERRTAVINFIYSAPMRRFADAFRLRREEDE